MGKWRWLCFVQEIQLWGERGYDYLKWNRGLGEIERQGILCVWIRGMENLKQMYDPDRLSSLGMLDLYMPHFYLPLSAAFSPFITKECHHCHHPWPYAAKSFASLRPFSCERFHLGTHGLRAVSDGLAEKPNPRIYRLVRTRRLSVL